MLFTKLIGLPQMNASQKTAQRMMTPNLREYIHCKNIRNLIQVFSWRDLRTSNPKCSFSVPTLLTRCKSRSIALGSVGSLNFFHNTLQCIHTLQPHLYAWHFFFSSSLHHTKWGRRKLLSQRSAGEVKTILFFFFSSCVLVLSFVFKFVFLTDD